jgi:hypothetical protein
MLNVKNQKSIVKEHLPIKIPEEIDVDSPINLITVPHSMTFAIKPSSSPHHNL